MRKIEHALDAAGYLVWNEGYPSRSASVEDLAGALRRRARSRTAAAAAPRASTSSRTRSAASSCANTSINAVPEIGRVVMLSPPNGGSEVAEHLGGLVALSVDHGARRKPARHGHGQHRDGLGAFPAECGIVTGSASLDPWFSAWLPAPHDGKVSVASATLDGMRDFLVVPRAHGLIMRDGTVISEVLHFLAHGRFAHDAETRT